MTIREIMFPHDIPDQENYMTLTEASICDKLPIHTTPINEASLKTKDRNALPDSAFGLPKERKYPLHDKSHVEQAIRMFGHASESERKPLAKAIIRQYKKFNLTTKIGKKNPLYEYVPEAMREAVGSGSVKVYGCEKPSNQRTDKEIMIEHLKTNSCFYNNLFYSPNYIDMLKKISDGAYQYLDQFYPSFKTHTFVTRTATSIGGLWQYFNQLSTEDQNRFLQSTESDDDFSMSEINMEYNQAMNWFIVGKTDSSHIKFAIKLYILLDRLIQCNGDLNRVMETNWGIEIDPQDIFHDWVIRIEYYWNEMQSKRPNSTEYFEYAQALHDLFWDPLDSPIDMEVQTDNVLSYLYAISAESVTGLVSDDSDTERLYSDDLIQKQQMMKYIASEIMDDTIFLLSSRMEYPILDKTSVRKAIDRIAEIDRSDIEEYTENLNKKYHELHCTFKVQVSHPYARYATKDMIDINQVLSERTSTFDTNLPNAKCLNAITEFYYNFFGK